MNLSKLEGILPVLPTPFDDYGNGSIKQPTDERQEDELGCLLFANKSGLPQIFSEQVQDPRFLSEWLAGLPRGDAGRLLLSRSDVLPRLGSLESNADPVAEPIGIRNVHRTYISRFAACYEGNSFSDSRAVDP